MDLSRLLDPGLIITAPAAVAAFGWGKDRWPGNGKWIRRILLFAWIVSALGVISGAGMDTTVFLASVVDAAIAAVAVVVLIGDATRNDAKAVGVISLGLYPAHLVVSICQGLTHEGWLLYAGACNAAFIAQCFIVRGWLDGLGRTIAHFLGRLRSLPLLRFLGR